MTMTNNIKHNLRVQAAVDPVLSKLVIECGIEELLCGVKVEKACIRVHIRVFQEQRGGFHGKRPSEVLQAHAKLRIFNCQIFKIKRM